MLDEEHKYKNPELKYKSPEHAYESPESIYKCGDQNVAARYFFNLLKHVSLHTMWEH